MHGGKYITCSVATRRHLGGGLFLCRHILYVLRRLLVLLWLFRTFSFSDLRAEPCHAFVGSTCRFVCTAEMLRQQHGAKLNKPMVWFMRASEVLAVSYARIDTPRLRCAAEI